MGANLDKFSGKKSPSEGLDGFKSPLNKLREEISKIRYAHEVEEELNWWWGMPAVKESWEKSRELPPELKKYRQAWEENMDEFDQNKKDTIKDVVEKIPVRLDVDSDGSRLIEFQLKNKTYKILDPKLNNHTDDGDEYKIHAKYDSVSQIDRDNVMLWGMVWDNVDEWENQKLKEYVKQKQKEWLHIPKIEEVKTLLEELWNMAWLTNEMDQVAMLMYLTWMDGSYWLSMWDDKMSGSTDSRSRLDCDPASDGDGCFYYSNCIYEKDYDGNLLMISVN